MREPLLVSRAARAIRIGALGDIGAMQRKLADSHRILVAAPGYLDRAGLPTSPQEMS